MVRVRLLDHEDRPRVVASEERAGVLDRVLEDGGVSVEVGVVGVREIAAWSERQAEEATFTVGVGEVGGIEHGGQGSVRQPQDPPTLLHDVQTGVALTPRQVDRPLGDTDLGEGCGRLGGGSGGCRVGRRRTGSSRRRVGGLRRITVGWCGGRGRRRWGDTRVGVRLGVIIAAARDDHDQCDGGQRR